MDSSDENTEQPVFLAHKEFAQYLSISVSLQNVLTTVNGTSKDDSTCNVLKSVVFCSESRILEQIPVEPSL